MKREQYFYDGSDARYSGIGENDPFRDIPIGLGMALMQNLSAYDAYMRLPGVEREAFVRGAGDVRSREEMRDYVLKLNDEKKK